jgi:putative colanic acid biosynthesis UDP-glucose lipid carrier transferase
MMRLLDIALIWIAGEVVSRFRFGSSLDQLPLSYSILLYLSCALAFGLFVQTGLYVSWRGRSVISLVARIVLSWTLVAAIGILISFMTHHASGLSRLWVAYWYLLVIGFLLVFRTVIYKSLRYLRHKGLNGKKVLIVGYGPAGREMHRRAFEQDWYGYDVMAIHTGTEHSASERFFDPAIDNVRSLEDIPDYVAKNGVHEIWITLPLSASTQLLRLQFLLRNALVDIKWMPDAISMHILSSKLSNFMGFPVFDLNRPSIDEIHGILKAIFDKIFSFVVLTLLLPLLIAISIAIKLTSPGPIIFKQPRLGLNGRTFNVYKFRTMVLHTENGQVTQARNNDPRVTAIGKFLRRTSLDELPQFINVLKGDMSVVGPRPHALPHNNLYKEKLELYMLRHRVKPGITGWAQINGCRGETDTLEKMVRRVEYDLDYIKNWSFWMDIKIVAWTAWRGWTGLNAY